MSSDSERRHIFHAHAYVMDATLEQPVTGRTGRLALADLPGDGKYQFQTAIPYQLQGVLSYRSGYAQVSGHRNHKKDRGFTTNATSVVDGLNILDVVTADRVVGQISTTHPPNGHAPSVTFQGTRFVNLRIDGHKVDVDTDLNILGQAPKGGASYLDDAGLLSRMSQQHAKIRGAADLPDWAGDHLRENGVNLTEGRASCSVVRNVHGFGGVSFGHILEVPHFGKIFLGELTVERKDATSNDEDDAYHFQLTMIRLQMGSVQKGTAKIAAMDANGKGSKGGGG